MVDIFQKTTKTGSIVIKATNRDNGINIIRKEHYLGYGNHPETDVTKIIIPHNAVEELVKFLMETHNVENDSN